MRHFELTAFKDRSGKMVPVITNKRRAQPLPPQERELVKCPSCNREKLLSVGQIWNCKHKD